MGITEEGLWLSKALIDARALVVADPTLLLSEMHFPQLVRVC